MVKLSKHCVLRLVVAVVAVYALVWVVLLFRSDEYPCKGRDLASNELGTFNVTIAGDHRYMSLDKVCTGELWEPHVLEAIEKYQHNWGDSIDLGANAGVLTVPLARRSTPYSVYAFEGDADNVELLKSNLILNNVRNAFVYNGLIQPTFQVPAELLNSDKPLTFMKLDCEGCEYNFLRAFEELIRRKKPVIVFEALTNELLASKDFTHTREELIALVESFGYRAPQLLPEAVWDYVAIPLSYDIPSNMLEYNEVTEVGKGGRGLQQ